MRPRAPVHFRRWVFPLCGERMTKYASATNEPALVTCRRCVALLGSGK